MILIHVYLYCVTEELICKFFETLIFVDLYSIKSIISIEKKICNLHWLVFNFIDRLFLICVLKCNISRVCFIVEVVMRNEIPVTYLEVAQHGPDLTTLTSKDSMYRTIRTHPWRFSPGIILNQVLVIYVTVDILRNGQWNDRPCSVLIPFICEKENTHL